MPLAMEEAGWRRGFRTLADETPDPVTLPAEGAVPPTLVGTLYRIGPARHEVGGERNGSWFDGDGMVHAFNFDSGRVTYRSRFVQSQKLKDETAAGRRLYGGFGTRSPVGGLRRLQAIKSVNGNPANTHVVAHAGALFALCEGGQPYRLAPGSLATLGADDLGAIPDGETFTAHAKHDPPTGELWNIGFRRGPTLLVSVYRRDARGHTAVVMRRPMPLNTLVHDFAITRSKLIIIASPLVLPRVPLGLLTHRSFLRLLKWRPELGTRIIVLDRSTGEVREHRAEALMLHHTANAFDDGGDAVVDLCAYPDASIFSLFEGALAGHWPEVRHASPERLRLTADGRTIRRKLSSAPCEFPRVAPGAWMGRHRYIYGISGYLGAPIRIDVEAGAVEPFWSRPGEFAGELVPVPMAGAAHDEEVWLLGLVLGLEGRTELRVFDGREVGAPPVARIHPPCVLPFDFHGNWLPRGSSATLP